MLKGEKQVLMAPASATTTEQVCQLDYLHTMSGGNKAFEKELILLYLKQAPAELEKLANAVQAADMPALRYVAHKLKSSAAILGIATMVSCLKQIEALPDEAAGYAAANQVLPTLVTTHELATKELDLVLASY